MAARLVTPFWSAGSDALPLAKAKRHDGRALILDQPGLEAERRGDLLDLNRLGMRRQEPDDARDQRAQP